MTPEEFEDLLKRSELRLGKKAKDLSDEASAQTTHALRQAEKNLSARTLELQHKVSLLSDENDALTRVIEQECDAMIADIAEFKQFVLNTLEDDRKNQKALIHQQIEKVFASFTTAKVKEIMRKEASS